MYLDIYLGRDTASAKRLHEHQRRLRSACASAQSDQSHRCPPKDALDPLLLTDSPEKTLFRLCGCASLSVFDGPTCNLKEIVGSRLIFVCVLGRYADIGEYYRSWYEDSNFETDVRNLYEEFKPLYSELHAYVRRKLKAFYKDEHFPDSGHIPAHLFGTAVSFFLSFFIYLFIYLLRNHYMRISFYFLRICSTCKPPQNHP